MIDWIDIKALFAIVLILTVSSFALYFPLAAIFDNKIAAKFVIPISISVQIIFAYIFYSYGVVKLYPPIYATLILILNIWAIWKLKYSFSNLHMPSLKQIIQISAPLILFCIIIYSRFYDSFTNIAPGEIDTYNHMVFLKDLVRDGLLSFPQYAPGFHLLLYPLTLLVPVSEIYRFTGPTIGVITAASLYLLLKESFVHKFAKYALLTLLCLPIFNQLFLQEIGFFSTSLSFLIVPAMIYIIAETQELKQKRFASIFFLLLVTCLSLTLPYLYVQYLPALAVLFLIVLIFRKHFDRQYFSRLLMVIIVSAIGFLVAFGHVYLQTKVLKRGTNFPAMELTYIENGEIVTTNNFQQAATVSQADSANTEGDNANTEGDNTNTPTASAIPSQTNTDSNKSTLKDKFEILIDKSVSFIKTSYKNSTDKITKNEFFLAYVSPMSKTAWNALMVKNVRTPDSILSIGAYVWIFISMILVPISIHKKNNLLFTVSVFCIVFGVCTQFGIMEIGTYRGRSGWYLMLFTLVSVSLIGDNVLSSFRKISDKVLLLIIVLLGASGLLSPPTYYRPYYSEPYEIIRDITRESPKALLNVLANDSHLSIVSTNVTVNALSSEALEKRCYNDICLIIIENQLRAVDPVLSQQASSIDKNYQLFNQQQAEAKQRNAEQILAIKKLPQFSSYKLYWKNENIDIYEYQKTK